MSIRYSLNSYVLSFADTLTAITSYVLAMLAAAEVTRGWWHDRERHRSELIATLGLLIAILLTQIRIDRGVTETRAEAAAFVLLCLSAPVLLLRLAGHFHPVRRWHLVSTASIAIASAVLSVLMPTSLIDAWHLVLSGYCALALYGVAVLFQREAARASGAGAMRLHAVVWGSGFNAAIAIAFALGVALPEAAPVASAIRKVLGLGMFGCYSVALIGPRELTSLWTDRRLYRFLQVMSEHPPDERARETPIELARAATQSVAVSATSVVLFDPEDAHTLLAYSATPSPLRGLSIPFGTGLVSEAIRRKVILSGSPRDCEGALADAAAHAGSAVTVVPIASDDHAWGALVVVQRTGSLFPDVDQRALAALCQHSASALAHAQLVTLEFERLRRDAAVLRAERDAWRRGGPVGGALAPDAEGRLRVLAVEDEEGVRDYLRALLSREGYRVTLASGYEHALQLSMSTPFDLVVTDVNMPDGSGPDLVKALRRRQPYLPAVFISGISKDEFAEMAPGEERNFLQKPFEGARLIGRIEALLQR